MKITTCVALFISIIVLSGCYVIGFNIKTDTDVRRYGMVYQIPFGVRCAQYCTSGSPYDIAYVIRRKEYGYLRAYYCIRFVYSDKPAQDMLEDGKKMVSTSRFYGIFDEEYYKVINQKTEKTLINNVDCCEFVYDIESTWRTEIGERRYYKGYFFVHPYDKKCIVFIYYRDMFVAGNAKLCKDAILAKQADAWFSSFSFHEITQREVSNMSGNQWIP
jgi:hypothetical protein